MKNHPTIQWFKENTPGAAREKINLPMLKNLALECGADDAGVTHAGHSILEQDMPDILSVFPGTKSLISVVIRLNPDNIGCVSRDVAENEYIYGNERVNDTLRKMSQALNAKGIRAMHPAAAFPMDMSKWPGKTRVVSHKTVARAAGMGQLGHNRLLLHPEYGNFIFLGTLLLDSTVDTYDDPLDYNPCIKCKLCVAACPTGAVYADGHFSFVNCMVHNYRDRMGGFSDWTENIVKSRNVKEYRRRVSDPETMSMWQSLSYGICNKSSYCMAVCPAGTQNIGQYLSDKKAYIKNRVKILQEKQETIYVLKGSDSMDHVGSRYPHKKIKIVGSGVRPASAMGFISSLPLVFQKKKSKGINACFNFTFTGDENFSASVGIENSTLTVDMKLNKAPDITIVSDARTWLDFLAGEKNMLLALISRKIKIKGPLKFMNQFQQCFPK